MCYVDVRIGHYKYVVLAGVHVYTTHVYSNIHKAENHLLTVT